MAFGILGSYKIDVRSHQPGLPSGSESGIKKKKVPTLEDAGMQEAAHSGFVINSLASS